MGKCQLLTVAMPTEKKASEKGGILRRGLSRRLQNSAIPFRKGSCEQEVEIEDCASQRQVFAFNPSLKEGGAYKFQPLFSLLFKFNKYFQNPREPRGLKALRKSSCRAKRKPNAASLAPQLQSKLIPADVFICGNIFFLKFSTKGEISLKETPC